MVLGTLPRVVGPGELVSLPVNVFKYKEDIKNATITVETSGVLGLRDANKQTIELRESNGTLYFDLAVAEKLGPGKVTITASRAVSRPGTTSTLSPGHPTPHKPS